MAITALATQNTQVGPAQFADMAEVLTAPAKVDRPTDLRPTRGTGRSLTIAAGAGTAGGSRIRSTSVESVTLDAQSSGTRWDAVCLRIDWSTSVVRPVVVKGSSSTVPINTSSAADPAKVNRIPGVMYDHLICVCSVAASGISNLIDYRMWGGDGGPYRVSEGALGSPTLLDARAGTWISTDKGLLTKRLDDDGVWRAVGTESNPWKTWTPTLRYYGNDIVTGTSGGTVAGMGNGPIVNTRYRITDGIVDAYVYAKAGSTGATWGDGFMTMDLPVPAASQTNQDIWCIGHLFTSGYGGDGDFDWQAQALIKGGWTRAMLWTNGRIDDCRLTPYVCQQVNGGPGSGSPFINGGYPVGSWTFNLKYPTDA